MHPGIKEKSTLVFHNSQATQNVNPFFFWSYILAVQTLPRHVEMHAVGTLFNAPGHRHVVPQVSLQSHIFVGLETKYENPTNIVWWGET